MQKQATQLVSPQTNFAATKADRSWFNDDRRNIALLLTACLFLFFVGLSSWGLIDPGDGYFSETAREMIERNDYIVPHLNYQIYFSKPILIYWLIIAAYKVFGVTEFAARFWSAALATGMVVTSYWTTRSIVSKRAGVFAGLVFASAPLVVTFARMALIDMGFACLLGFALCATAMTVLTASNRWWPWIYVALALAVLDKGPAGLALYLVGVAGFALVFKRGVRDKLQLLGRLRLHLGIPLFTAIALPWYVAVGVATNWLWPQVFFFFENVGRFAGHTNHRNPYIWFYLPVLAYGFFPWMLFLPSALVAAVKATFRPQTVAKSDAEEAARGYFLLAAGWTVAVLALFSLSMTKLQTYILPAFPAMAIIIGITLDRLAANSEDLAEGQKQHCAWLKAVATVLAVGAVAAVAAAGLGTAIGINPEYALQLASQWLPHSAQAKLPQATAILADTPLWMKAGLIAVTGTFGLGLLATVKWLGQPETVERGLLCLCATTVFSCALGAPILFQLGYKYKDADVQTISVALSGRPGPVALYGDFKPGLIWHVQRPVDTIFSCEQLHSRQTGEPAVQYIITGRKGSAELLSRYPAQLQTLAHKGDWYIFEAHDLVALRLPTLERSFKEHIDLSGGDFSWGTLPFAGGTK